MCSRVSALGIVCLLPFLVMPVRGQEAAPDKEPAAVLEIGAATSWEVTGGAASFAPNFAVETRPIENWLELEAGVSPFFMRNSRSA
jgi:hypothetical protein